MKNVATRQRKSMGKWNCNRTDADRRGKQVRTCNEYDVMVNHNIIAWVQGSGLMFSEWRAHGRTTLELAWIKLKHLVVTGGRYFHEIRNQLSWKAQGRPYDRKPARIIDVNPELKCYAWFSVWNESDRGCICRRVMRCLNLTCCCCCPRSQRW